MPPVQAAYSLAPSADTLERLREFARGRRDGFQQTRIGLVLADAEFDSERNHTYIRKQLGAQSVIPAKRGKKNLTLPRSACGDAAGIPATDLKHRYFSRECQQSHTILKQIIF
ncbi:MAG TPA: hypothetical protein VNE63_16345 [Candidatus Acidoferrales bacterium]|nr:hypothetical protein [Candidatus Acidoferrales bacterium]